MRYYCSGLAALYGRFYGEKYEYVCGLFMAALLHYLRIIMGEKEVNMLDYLWAAFAALFTKGSQLVHL